jgi:HD-GYP domain-containing protein (c-di-GMP phosphodiesterase class II)
MGVFNNYQINMKKISSIICITLLAAVVAIPAISKAEAPSSAGRTAPPSLGERMRADIKTKTANIKNNQEIRNELLERQASTSANSLKKEQDRRGKPATSTFEKAIKPNKVRAEVFENQKRHLVDQLGKALANLKQVRERIASRIAKAEQSGRNMSNAKVALAAADAKITAAEKAIKEITSFVPVQPSITASTASSTTASTTATSTATTITSPVVDVLKARQVGDKAIKAVSDAKNALNKVVVAIAHSMGFKVGSDGKIEVPTTTSGTNTGTTTAITTTPTPTPTSTGTTTSTNTNSTTTATTTSNQ